MRTWNKVALGTACAVLLAVGANEIWNSPRRAPVANELREKCLSDIRDLGNTIADLNYSLLRSESLRESIEKSLSEPQVRTDYPDLLARAQKAEALTLDALATARRNEAALQGKSCEPSAERVSSALNPVRAEWREEAAYRMLTVLALLIACYVAAWTGFALKKGTKSEH